MADRSFEEKVRKELEALRFTPDAQVWENVQAELRKEKKYRWLAWFVVLTGLAGSAALYYQLGYAPKDTEMAVHPQKTSGQTSGTTAISGSDAAAHMDKSNSTGKTEAPQNRPSSISGTSEDHPSASEKISSGKTGYFKAQPTVVVATIKSDPPVITPDEKPSARVDKSTEGTNETVLSKPLHQTEKENKPAEPAKTPVIISVPVQQDLANKQMAQANVEKTNAVIEQPVMTAKADSMQSIQEDPILTTASVVKKDKNKWRLFGSAEIGRSGEVVSLVQLNKSMLDAPVAAAPNPSPPSQGGGASSGSTNNSPSYKTPSRKGGYSFGMHLQVLKNTGKKGSLGLSMGYSYYSSIVGVGSQVTGMANAFASRNTSYLSTDSISYRNSYHFLSLAGDYYWNFRLGPAASLRWRMGLGLGFLLSSNVLHYNAGQRVLYEDRSALSTVHANLSTGLEWGIGKQQLFFIGPQLSYFLSESSVNSSPASNRHLFNASLRATMAIPKKKK